MGKNRTILRTDTLDSTEAGNTRIRLIKVSFDDGESDIYTVIDDENAVGKILEDAFLDGSQQSVFAGDSGFFSFRITSPFSRAALTSIKPVSKEQSNSAFCAPGKFFFKLYRRLEPGLHPEAEILEAMKFTRGESSKSIFRTHLTPGANSATTWIAQTPSSSGCPPRRCTKASSV